MESSLHTKKLGNANSALDKLLGLEERFQVIYLPSRVEMSIHSISNENVHSDSYAYEANN